MRRKPRNVHVHSAVVRVGDPIRKTAKPLPRAVAHATADPHRLLRRRRASMRSTRSHTNSTDPRHLRCSSSTFRCYPLSLSRHPLHRLLHPTRRCRHCPLPFRSLAQHPFRPHVSCATTNRTLSCHCCRVTTGNSVLQASCFWNQKALLTRPQHASATARVVFRFCRAVDLVAGARRRCVRQNARKEAANRP